jgi:uncharacterized protein DUF4345
MAFHLLRSLMFLASVLIVGIGLALFLLGSDTTMSLMLELIKPLLDNPASIADMGTPNVDSELRFFAPFFVAYGVLVYLCAKHLRTHLYYVPHLLGIFLIGGLGRGLSYVFIGPPHPMYLALMAIEIGLPVLFYFVYTRVVAKATKA